MQLPDKRKHCEIIEGKGDHALNLIKIMFPYDLTDIANVKTLANRRFISTLRCWTAPLTTHNLEQLQGWGFILSPELNSLLAQSKSKTSIENLTPIMEISGLKRKLYHYQGVGVAFMDSKDGRVLIADEMGLGKTIQALAWLQLHPEKKPVIIVVPASLKLNWVYEALEWMNIKSSQIVEVHGQSPYKINAEIVVINYDIVPYWLEYLKSFNFNVLIMDEIHMIKNSATKRTKAIKKLAKGIPHVIGLSGTPVMNRPVEMYNALSIINSSAIPNFKEYTKQFCGLKHNGFGWDYSGATNTDQLHQLLVGSFMIRRLKKDVLKELPDKRTCFVPIELDNWGEYTEAEDNFIDYLRSTKGYAVADKASNAETLVQINTLRQVAIQGKMAGVIDWINEFLESGEKLVVFATHISTIDMLTDSFPLNSVRFDGSVSIKKRDENVTKFQNDPDCKLFFGMIDTQGKPAGVGITLTAAYSTATIEFQWSPGVHDQADDRIHRIGQKNVCVNYKLMAAKTIDEKFAKLLDSKRETIDAIIDGVVTSKSNLLTELINSYI